MRENRIDSLESSIKRGENQNMNILVGQCIPSDLRVRNDPLERISTEKTIDVGSGKG